MTISLREAQARVQARVWQAVAQADLDLSAFDKATLEALVDLTTEAALLELDATLFTSLEAERETAVKTADVDNVFDDEKEDVLWEGRPFLSLVTHYTITDERIRITEGLLGKAHENVELVRVQDMDYSQTVSERILNLGDITIRSHDSSNPLIVLRNIPDPEAVHEILRRAVLSARKKHGFMYREEM
jgi:hypothetical protein